LKEIPVYERYREPKYAAELGSSPCDCPKCRARRGEPVDDSDPCNDDEDDFEDDFDDEDDSDQPAPPSFQNFMKTLEEILGKLPPALAQQVTDAIVAGEDPVTAISRVMGKAFPKPGSPASSQKGKAAKAPLPEQGSLF
jgi:hypothetical protein